MYHRYITILEQLQRTDVPQKYYHFRTINKGIDVPQIYYHRYITILEQLTKEQMYHRYITILEQLTKKQMYHRYMKDN